MSETRKNRLKAALALRGQTMWEFAADRRVSAWRLSRVINGALDDPKLAAEIDAYTDATLAKAAEGSAA